MLSDSIRRQYNHKIEDDKGIVVVASKGFEPYLYWWWVNYIKSGNTLPVNLFDLGINQEAKEWFLKRGRALSYSFPSFVKSFEEASPHTQKLWKEFNPKTYLEKWNIRKVWFLKPLICLLSPYKTTLYLDLDCIVLENLSPLLETCYDFSGVKEPTRIQISRRKLKMALKGEININSGVLLFKNDSILLGKWIERTIKDNQSFIGDQDVLSRIVFEEKFPFTYLSSRYNALPPHKVHENNAILHFCSPTGKNQILRNIAVFFETGLLNYFV